MSDKLKNFLEKLTPEMKGLFVKAINLHAGHQIKEHSNLEIQNMLKEEIEKMAADKGKSK